MNKDMKDHNLQKPVYEVLRPVTCLVNVHQTVQEALLSLKDKHIDEKIIYFYVIDENEKLVGVVSTRALLLSDSNTLISDIMQWNVVRIFSRQNLQVALEIFAKHNLLALPVVDDDGRLIGAIDVNMYMEESFDILNAQHRRDVFQFIGLSLEERSSVKSYFFRMPWLLCNMLGGFICALISNLHELVLTRVILLAMFIPLVLSLSESVSMQSMTNSLQFLKRQTVTWRYSFLKAIKEWKTVGMVSITSGILVGLFSLLFQDGIGPSLIIGISITFSIFISASFGILIPIVLHKTKLDPKVASGPVVLMSADVLTTALYLTLANWWLL